MGQGFVITGTDTDVGKTVFAAALVQALQADYWKPVQAGLDALTDSETVAALCGSSIGKLHPEACRLRLPASPHFAAEQEGVTIAAEELEPPETDNILIVEGAGGLLVPLNRDYLTADLFERWQLPLIIVARTGLGTINHSLLTIAAARERGLPIHGIAFVGEAVPSSEDAIVQMGEVKRLGRLPRLDPLDSSSLAAAFADNFDVSDFK